MAASPGGPGRLPGVVHTIRTATLRDVPAIAEVNVASWRAAYRGQFPDHVLDALSVEERSQRRGEWMADDGGEMRHWVLLSDDRIAGYADSGPARDVGLAGKPGEVWTIYLHPDFWDAGAGRLLFAHSVDDLRDRGFGPLVLWVLETNARARAFYEAAGWAWDGATRTDDEPGYTVYEVRYRLG